MFKSWKIMLPTRRVRKYATLPICQGLTPEESRNYFHKSNLPSYTFQDTIPRLPIPSLENTLKRYTASLKAQQGKHITENDIKNQENLIQNETPLLEDLHQKLLDYDNENLHTSYISNAWFEMYLKDRSRLPFNVTPYIGLKQAEKKPHLNEVTLRASNIIISSLRLNNTLDKGYLEPELFGMAKPGQEPTERTWNLSRKLIKAMPKKRFLPPVGGFTVPIGLPTILAYPLLKSAPLDMSQYKNLFKSTRIPGVETDEIKKFQKSDHVLVMCRGRFYKLTCYEKSSGNILDYKSIQRSVQDILADAKSKEYNNDSIAYLSSMERTDWAKIRPTVIETSENNSKNLESIDSAIFNIVLEDQLQEKLEFDVKSTQAANSCFLWGNGANRWWDKSITWIVTEGGDCGLTFEHSWGDGVAVMRCAKDVWNESTGEYEHLGRPAMLNESNSTAEPAPWEELKFDLDSDGKISNAIQKAKKEYNDIADDIGVGAAMIPGVGKNFFKQRKLGGDAVVQLAIQAAFKRANNLETAPVYQSASTSGFLHGRTENLRPCSIASSKAADLLSAFDVNKQGDNTQNLLEIAAAIRESGKVHNELKTNAVTGQGFDRHIFALNYQAKLHGIDLPESFNPDQNETWKRMNHFIVSTSTLDMPFSQSGGFGCVVPDGLGCGYASMAELMACNVTSRKSTQLVDPEDFAVAFGETFGIIEKVFEAEGKQKKE